MSTLAQDNKQADKDTPPMIRFRASDEFHERVRIAAIKSKVSVQQLCTEALTEYLDRRDGEVTR